MSYQKFYTTEETAQIIRCSVEAIRLYIRQKRLNARKVGRKFLVSESDIEQFIENKESEVSNG
jgi:excisionase family DNA binding protein